MTKARWANVQWVGNVVFAAAFDYGLDGGFATAAIGHCGMTSVANAASETRIRRRQQRAKIATERPNALELCVATRPLNWTEHQLSRD